MIIRPAGDGIVLYHTGEQASFAERAVPIKNDILAFFVGPVRDFHASMTHLAEKIGEDFSKIILGLERARKKIDLSRMVCGSPNATLLFDCRFAHKDFEDGSSKLSIQMRRAVHLGPILWPTKSYSMQPCPNEGNRQPRTPNKSLESLPSRIRKDVY